MPSPEVIRLQCDCINLAEHGRPAAHPVPADRKTVGSLARSHERVKKRDVAPERGAFAVRDDQIGYHNDPAPISSISASIEDWQYAVAYASKVHARARG